MNHAFRPVATEPRTTRAADGMERRAFTVAEVEAMVAAGILDEDERIELIGGEIVPMSPKGTLHEWVKRKLNRHFQLVLPEHLDVLVETTVRFDERAYFEPDFCVVAASDGPVLLRAFDLLLAVEVADTSLSYDLGRKIGLYAAYGVREVWVIDAATLVTRIHRRLGAEGYADIREFGPAERLVPGLAPELAVTLAELGLTPARDADPESR